MFSGLHLHTGTPHGNKMNIINLEDSTVESSLDFQRGPDAKLYSYWKAFNFEKIHEDVSTVAWCTEELALVVCFEDWRGNVSDVLTGLYSGNVE